MFGLAFRGSKPHALQLTLQVLGLLENQVTYMSQSVSSGAEELLVWGSDLDFKLDLLLPQNGCELLRDLAGGLTHGKPSERVRRRHCLGLAMMAEDVVTGVGSMRGEGCVHV